jgi:hypothetical protein
MDVVLELVIVGTTTHLAELYSDWTLCLVPIGPDSRPGTTPTCRHCAGRLPEEA